MTPDERRRRAIAEDVAARTDRNLRDAVVQRQRERVWARVIEARIVAWLRQKSAAHHSLAVQAGDAGDLEMVGTHSSISHTYAEAAIAIERREHEKEQDGG